MRTSPFGPPHYSEQENGSLRPPLLVSMFSTTKPTCWTSIMPCNWHCIWIAYLVPSTPQKAQGIVLIKETREDRSTPATRRHLQHITSPGEKLLKILQAQPGSFIKQL